MAYYITDDGRVHEVDVEVKNDGSVRPQRYSDFVSTENQQDVKKKHNYDKTWDYVAQKHKKSRQINEESRNKKRNNKRKKKGNVFNTSQKIVFSKDTIFGKINSIIQDSNLSENALAFIQKKVDSLSFTRITDKFKACIVSYGLSSELDTILKVIGKINVIILLLKTAPEQILSPRKKGIKTKNKNKSFKNLKTKVGNCTSTEKNTQFHSYSRDYGNQIRKGPMPKYGYARDRFGRVQERDSYREDKVINPYSINSSYDSEDDHDSMDILD